MRIDSHQHFWKLSRGDYGWLTPDKGPIYRDFGPADLAPFRARNAIARTIVVQAAPTVAETRFMLEIAAADPSIAGVVGWVDFTATDAPAAIRELARDPLLVGLRPMVHDIPDDDWLLRADIAPALREMEAAGLVFDALVQPRHLSRLLAFADRYPGLPVIVDHGAKPFIRERKLDPWRAEMAAFAARTHVVCKLSGLATEAAADWRPADLAPYVDHMLAVFGPGRLLWGSDWPVVDLAGGYDRWFDAAAELTARLGQAERDAIFGGNAARIYLSKRGRK
ncbi:MAG: amidohydrolase family protein [Rhodospirillales bacterium]|nr:amidohydrolase family protein [Rhodospirillales bacterium]